MRIRTVCYLALTFRNQIKSNQIKSNQIKSNQFYQGSLFSLQSDYSHLDRQKRLRLLKRFILKLTSRCFLVSGWFSCQDMMLLYEPCITDSAALLAHWVLNTKIWEDCCRYCWSILFCCLLSTLLGRGWELEGGTSIPGPGPPGPLRLGPPSPKSRKN